MSKIAEKKALEEYPLVDVRWTDSCSDGNWRYTSDIGEETTDITTVGYIVKDEENYIVIAQSLCKDPKLVCNTMAIPRGCIKEIITLTR